MLVAFALLFVAIFAIFGRWTHFRLSWKSAMGLGVVFGVPAVVAAWGIHRAWCRERWYITPDGATVVSRSRTWSGEREERFITAEFVFELSNEVGKVGTSFYQAQCLKMRPQVGRGRGMIVKYGRADAGDVMTAVSTLRERGVEVLVRPRKC